MTEQPIGPILDGLNVTVDLNDGDLVESAVVLLKVLNHDGTIAVDIVNSAGMDWLGQLALVTAASRIVNDNPYEHPDGE